MEQRNGRNDKKEKKKNSRFLIIFAILFIVSMLSIVISAIYYNYKKPVLREVSDKQEISIFEKRYNFNLIDGEKLEVVTKKPLDIIPVFAYQILKAWKM